MRERRRIRTWLAFARRLLAASAAAFFILSLSTPERRGQSSSPPTTPRRRTSRRSSCPTTTSSSRARTPTGSTFPKGSLKAYKTVMVKDFEHNGKGRESRDAARDGKEYMEQWLEKQGFNVVEKGGGHRRRGQRLQRLGAERRGPVLGRLGGQPGRGHGAADQGQERRRGRRDPAEGQGLDDPRRRRERPRGHVPSPWRRASRRGRVFRL